MWKYNRYVEVPLVYDSLLPQVAAEGKECSYLLVETDGAKQSWHEGLEWVGVLAQLFFSGMQIKRNCARQFGFPSGARMLQELSLPKATRFTLCKGACTKF